MYFGGWNDEIGDDSTGDVRLLDYKNAIVDMEGFVAVIVVDGKLRTLFSDSVDLKLIDEPIVGLECYDDNYMLHTETRMYYFNNLKHCTIVNLLPPLPANRSYKTKSAK